MATVSLALISQPLPWSNPRPTVPHVPALPLRCVPFSGRGSSRPRQGGAIYEELRLRRQRAQIAARRIVEGR